VNCVCDTSRNSVLAVSTHAHIVPVVSTTDIKAAEPYGQATAGGPCSLIIQIKGIENFFSTVIPLTRFKTGGSPDAEGVKRLLVVDRSANDILQVVAGVDANRDVERSSSGPHIDGLEHTGVKVLAGQVSYYAVVHSLRIALIRCKGEARLEAAELRCHVGEVHRAVDVVGHGSRETQAVDRCEALGVTRVVDAPAGGRRRDVHQVGRRVHSAELNATEATVSKDVGTVVVHVVLHFVLGMEPN